MKLRGVYVSRADRIGDLVLSLPVLGLLRGADVPWIGLQVSPYALDVGEWALENGLCDALYAGDAPTAARRSAPEPLAASSVGLSLFHSPVARDFFRAKGLDRTYGPRNKLSSLWSYRRTLAQHRSRVERSEAAYNLELAEWMLADFERKRGEALGIPALRVPPTWRAPRASPRVLLVATNRGSAADWPFERYLDWVRSFREAGHSVDLLLNGVDAPARKEALRASGWLDRGVGVVEEFARVRELIAYVAGCGLVVSSSTGPLHLAHAAGVPVLGIYPRAPRVQSFDRWRPDGYRHGAAIRYVEIGEAEAWTAAELAATLT